MLVPFLDAAAHIRDQQPQARFRLVATPNASNNLPRFRTGWKSYLDEDIQHAEAAFAKVEQ